MQPDMYNLSENKKLYFFFASWQMVRKLNTQKWITFYFRGQNKTEYNRLSILLL